MRANNTFLYPSSIWLVKRLKVSKARTDRVCDVCQIGVYQNDDFPGEYLNFNLTKVLCVRCAFRFVSHPVFKGFHTLTYDEVMSSDFKGMLLFKKLREVYKFDHIYKELVREDRQNEERILMDAAFDTPSGHYEKVKLYAKHATFYNDPYIKFVLDRMEREE